MFPNWVGQYCALGGGGGRKSANGLFVTLNQTDSFEMFISAPVSLTYLKRAPMPPHRLTFFYFLKFFREFGTPYGESLISHCVNNPKDHITKISGSETFTRWLVGAQALGQGHKCSGKGHERLCQPKRSGWPKGKFSIFAPHCLSVQKVQTTSITQNSGQVSQPLPTTITTPCSFPM